MFLVSLFFAGCATDTHAADILAMEGDATAGETLFADNCASCHGADATGGSGPDLSFGLGDEDEVETILNGEEDMPAFADTLSDQDIADIIAWTNTL
jgi:mono/diheme cytochrome c family protein